MLILTSFTSIAKQHKESPELVKAAGLLLFNFNAIDRVLSSSTPKFDFLWSYKDELTKEQNDALFHRQYAPNGNETFPFSREELPKNVIDAWDDFCVTCKGKTKYRGDYPPNEDLLEAGHDLWVCGYKMDPQTSQLMKK